jgi:hypothetical protein
MTGRLFSGCVILTAGSFAVISATADYQHCTAHPDSIRCDNPRYPVADLPHDLPGPMPSPVRTAALITTTVTSTIGPQGATYL